eukprot:IDg7164t1
MKLSREIALLGRSASKREWWLLQAPFPTAGPKDPVDADDGSSGRKRRRKESAEPEEGRFAPCHFAKAGMTLRNPSGARKKFMTQSVLDIALSSELAVENETFKVLIQTSAPIAHGFEAKAYQPALRNSLSSTVELTTTGRRRDALRVRRNKRKSLADEMSDML